MTTFRTVKVLFSHFTTLHTIQGGISHEKHVRLSVRLSVKRYVNCDKTKQKLLPIFLVTYVRSEV